MASTSSGKRSSTAGAPDDVGAFLAALEHPRKQEILALRAIILGADARIAESIKWNAPSFHTVEHFATFHLRAKEGVQVVLHLGAKPRPDAPVRAAIVDDASLLGWRGPDRATVAFRDMPDVEARGDAFARVVRQWITFL
jgi:hypothetical protein